MSRLIPKKSKINMTVYKNFTILDIVFLLCLMIIGMLIVVSNLDFLIGLLPLKWVLLIVYIPICVGLFIGNDDTRIYKEIVHILRFRILNKKYGAAAKKNTKKNDINLLLPQSNIDANGFIDYGEYFGAVLSLGSIEYRLLNDYMQDQKINLFAEVINYLADEQTMQIVKIDRPINFDEISERLYNKVIAAKDENAEPARIAILKSRLQQIDRINNIEKQFRPYYYLVFYDETIEGLKGLLEFAKQSLNDAGLNPTQLTQKEVAVFLKYCYTRDFDERDIDNFTPDKYLDFVKPKSIRFKTFNYEVDDIYAFTYAISDYPLQVSNAWGAALFNIDNTKVVLNIKPIDKDKSVKRIDRAITELGTRGENLNKASEIISQGTHIETMAQLLTGLQNENEMLFDCTLSITGFNYNCKDRLYSKDTKDKMQQREIRKDNMMFRRKIRRLIMSHGFRPSMLMCRQFDGLVSSSITRRNNLRTFERGINSLSLAAVFPFVFTSIIEPDGLTLGHNRYPVCLDVWKRDANHTNSNMFVVGKSGAGKSYFAKNLLSLLHSDNCKISILDPENEYNEMAKNFGGKLIDVGNATTGRLNPFHIYDVLTDDGKPAPPDVTFSSHLRFLESFFRVVLPGIAADSIEELNNFVLKTYQERGITAEINCSGLGAEHFPTFDDLLKIIKKAIHDEKGNAIRQNNLQRVETYIAKFAGDGRNANLWNGASTLTSKERFEVFNFQSLLEGKNSTISNGQMLLVMRYLEQQIINIRELNRNGGEVLHPIIVLDEGYNFVDPNYPIALDFVYSWYKRIRKYGGFIIFLTQNLGDIFGNKEIISKTTAIVNNSQYSFLFGLAPADIDTLKDLYRNAGEINETEANEIANAGTGQCFLVSSPRECTSFNVVASDTVKELFSKTVSNDRIAELAMITQEEM
jgi:hypothetical protein